MKMLLKGSNVLDFAPQIEFGKFEKGFEEWRLTDENGNLICYWIDDGFTVAEDITIPSDYESGKYLFVEGEWILNKEWKPYVSPEDRLEELEETVALQDELLTASDEAVVLLYEMQSTQSEINDAQDEAITGLYEIMLS